MSHVTRPRSRLQRTPLRVTLVVALVLLAAVGLTVTGVVVTAQLRGYLVDQVDQDLERLADRPPQRQGPSEDDNPFETSRDEYFALATLQGSVASPNERTTNDAVPARPRGGRASSAPPASRRSRSPGPDGDEWRVVVRRAVARDSATGQPVPALYLRGISLDDVQDTTRRLVLVELLVGARRPDPARRARVRRRPHVACVRWNRSSRPPPRSRPAT